MTQFTSYDGTKLAFRRAGAGRPLVCLPGGPGRTPDYLGDLGGLGASRELILPDTRGTGESAVPADPATYRCDRLARDVEALRAELGLERIDLLGQAGKTYVIWDENASKQLQATYLDERLVLSVDLQNGARLDFVK